MNGVYFLFIFFENPPEILSKSFTNENVLLCLSVSQVTKSQDYSGLKATPLLARNNWMREVPNSILVKLSPVVLGCVRLCQVLSSSVKFCQVQSSFVKFS